MTVNFSTSGDLETVALSNGLTADVDLDPTAGGSVILTPRVRSRRHQRRHLRLFALGSAAGSDTLAQTITLTSPASTPTSRAISQPVSVSTEGQTAFDPASASVFVGAGTAVTFNLGASGTLTVTPVGGSAVNQTFSPAFFTNRAEFLLTAVPEPVALPLLAGAALAFTDAAARAVRPIV